MTHLVSTLWGEESWELFAGSVRDNGNTMGFLQQDHASCHRLDKTLAKFDMHVIKWLFLYHQHHKWPCCQDPRCSLAVQTLPAYISMVWEGNY